MNTPRPPTTQTRFASPPIRDVLKAIQECGTDLVSIRDRKLVLQAAVHRTKILLGADMAYVSLNDLAAGETYIHTTDGVRTEAYRTIRQPLGTGVLGAAAAGTSMAYTADYLSDRNFVHVPRIDRIVEGEGVKTVAAAPLHVGGRVVGALLVAHRAHARLPDRARFVLTQLAVQTSIALGQVAHADEVAQLRTQIRERGVSDAVKLREFERMLQLDDRLMEGLVHATGPGRVLEILAEVLEMFHVRARAKGLELSVHWNPGVPVTIMSDPLRLKQILVNLISNAVKFTERGSIRRREACEPT